MIGEHELREAEEAEQELRVAKLMEVLVRASAGSPQGITRRLAEAVLAAGYQEPRKK